MQALLIDNIGTLATPLGAAPLRGHAMDDLRIAHNAAILVRDGVIWGVYENGALPSPMPDAVQRLNAGGRLATPGLVDAHTHLVFGGYRQQEAWRRVRGDLYLDILRAGGGILDTVRKTRDMDFEALYDKSLRFVHEMLARGVTTCEAKSGYGLDIETEEKQLRVARALGKNTPMDIRATYLGAHAVPPEFAGRADAYVDFLVEEAIPRVAAQGLADFCDVFCEEGVFSIAQSRKILTCARMHGLRAKIHADELVPLGGGALAAELDAVSADHLIAADDRSLRKLAQSETVAVLLPQTSLYLDRPYARARDMLALGIPVALASDFNPGSCPSNNLLLSMTLGFLKYALSPGEVLTAATQNAACAIGLGERVGTLEAGKQADIVLWDAEDLSMLCYRMGSNLMHRVVKKGILLSPTERM